METRTPQPLSRYLFRRLLQAALSLLVITMVLYGALMLIPARARAELFIPAGKGGSRNTENIPEEYVQELIDEHHLDEPYLVQYGYWLGGLLSGDWGYSPTLQEDVLPALLRRTPATLELALYSLLLFIPLGLWSGVRAGWRPQGLFDFLFRPVAYFGLSMPPFILALLLLTVFYARLTWFPPGRLDLLIDLDLKSSGFHTITGLLTIDGILNWRPDITANALRHLVLPVVTLSLFHWATLGRIARTMIIDERKKDYLLAARARGLAERHIVWRHAVPSIMAPSLTAMALSAASIVTGVYIAEVIFLRNGISQVIVQAMSYRPDTAAVLGFAVYSAVMITLLMLVIDVVQLIVDPRVREEALGG